MVPFRQFVDPYHCHEGLRVALGEQRWGHANDLTRQLVLADGSAHIHQVESIWSKETNGHFGFVAQLDAIGAPPKPHRSPDDWDYAKRAGDVLGWRSENWWCCLEGSPAATHMSFAPTVKTSGPSSQFPRGCFPFYDALIDEPAGYSPRDAHGELLWTRWCDLWCVVVSASG